MAEELRTIIDSVRTRLQAELDAQLQALAEEHAQAVSAAKLSAEAEANERWAVQLREAKEATEREVQDAVKSVRTEFERERALEASGLRAEAEKLAAEAAERARAEANASAEQEREALERALADERESRTRAERERRTAAPSAEQLLFALREIDAAGTVSETLAAMVRAAAAQAPRTALFIANGDHLDEWAVAGVPPLAHDAIRTEDAAAGVLGTAIRERATARNDDGGTPAFASLPHGRAAVAIPLLLDGDSIGVLYGDEGHGPSSDAPWADVLDVVARHGAARLGYLTALRTAQAMRWLRERTDADGDAASAVAALPSPDEEEQAARRYARLLVSEIKLYNEAAVRTGREKHDLQQRLQTEIDRARRLYEERVSPLVPGRAQHFHQELVQTLAGGDASLLG
jgi:hypothetical protein